MLPALLVQAGQDLPALGRAAEGVRLPPLVDSAGLTLRWDNVEGDPYWAGGMEPVYSIAHGLHAFTLGPGERTMTRLPGNAILRIQLLGASLRPDDLEVWWSNGSGLAVRGEVMRSDTDETLLFYPAETQAVLVEVLGVGETPVEVALHVSRIELASADSPCWDRVSFPGATETLRPAGSLPFSLCEDRVWNVSSPALPAPETSVEGPARLLVFTRLVYPPEEGEASQSYRVRIRLDGTARELLFDTTPDGGVERIVGSTERLVGSERVAHFPIAEGRSSLVVEAPPSVLWKVVRCSSDELLIAGVHESTRLAGALPEIVLSWPRREALREPPAGSSAGPSPATRIDDVLGAAAALRVEPSSTRDAGLLLVACLRALARRLSAHPADRALAASVRARFTTFRSLMPVRKTTPDPLMAASFAPPQMLAPLEELEDIRLGAQVIRSELRGLSTGLFLRAPDSERKALVYRLPRRFAPGSLRIAVLHPTFYPGELAVAVGDADPLRVRVASENELSAAGFRPTRAEAARALLQEAALEGGGLRGPALGPIPEPADVGTLEIPLPQDANVVRLWATGDGIPPVVAVQYLGARSFVPTERERREALGGGAPGGKWFGGVDPAGASADLPARFRAWRAGGPDLAAASSAPAPIPLFRQIASHVERIRSALPAASSAPETPTLDRGGALESAALAASLERGGHWIPALEAWSEARSTSDADLFRDASLARPRLLLRLGEDFLAESLLRELWLRSHDPVLRDRAREDLLRLHSALDDPDARAAILATAAFEEGAVRALGPLAEVLVETGDHAAAFDILLSLPEEERPREPLLSCALELERWAAFDDALSLLDDPAERRFWRGLRAARQGREGEALEDLDAAGPRGAAMAGRIRAARGIRARLLDPSPAIRCGALMDWESWSEAATGPWLWEEDPALVVDCAGGESCRSISRDLLETWYRAEEARPVRIRIQGPVCLRVEARPLHERAATRPLDGWIIVSGRGWITPIPIGGGGPSDGLELVNQPDLLPGARVTRDLRFGPGRHDIEVGSPTGELLVRFLVRTSALDAGCLPRLTPARVAAVVRGTSPLQERPRETYSVEARLLAGGGRGRAGVRIPRPVPFDPSDGADVPQSLDPRLAARVALRLGSREHLVEYADLLRTLVESVEGVSVAERQLALAWLRDLGLAGGSVPGGPDSVRSWPGPRVAATVEDLPVEARVGALLAVEDHRALLRLPAPESPSAVRERLEALLYVAEGPAAAAWEARILGEAIARAHPGTLGSRLVRARLCRALSWKRISSLRAAAGFRAVAPDPWDPEDPDLRVRGALLRGIGPGDRVIAGGSVLGIRLRSEDATALRLGLRLAAVEGLPTAPCVVRCALDADAPDRVLLAPEGAEEIVDVDVPPGDHVFRLWIEDPSANAFVRVGRAEAGAGLTVETEESDEIDRTDGDGGASRRRYALSTPTAPLRCVVEGPTWIRIDELRDGRTWVSYRFVPGGWQELGIEPRAGEEEGLFRVFVRVPAHDRLPPPPVRTDRRIQGVPDPSFVLDSVLPPTILSLTDAYSLGGQEDGTFSLAVSLRRRKVFEEDEMGGAKDPDHYLELKGTYRSWDIARSLHLEASFLSRAHVDGGPTLGAEADLRYSPPWLPFTAALSATGYLQWPDGGLVAPGGPSEWSAAIRGTLSRRFTICPWLYHSPSAAAFGRLLSLESGGRYAGTTIDPDVFTTYKRDHRAGLVVSETVGYLPWLDTEIWGRVSLTTNEDFGSPFLDHVAGWIGWRQYLYGTVVDLGYSVACFLADEDRSEGYVRHAAFLELLHDVWLGPRDRLEIGFGYRHDFPDDADTGFLSVTWHFSNGRHYRDFLGSDARFRALRETRIPRGYNNSIAERRDE